MVYHAKKHSLKRSIEKSLYTLKNMTSNTPYLQASDTILLLASSSTGNNIFCTPAIRFLRKHLPHTKIDLIALNDLSAEVFQDSPDINQLYVLRGAKAFDKIAKNYSKVVCLGQRFHRDIKGYQTPFITIPNYSDGLARGEQQLQYMSGLVGQPITESDRHYVIGNGIQTPYLGLAQYDVAPNQQLVCIHLGCGTTLLHGWKFFYKDRANDARLWPVERYIALGQALILANPNVRIVITGTKNERFLAKKFEKNVPNTINLVSKTSAKDLFDLMASLSLFIAHDCGVFHIASASTVPIVGLYGPTDAVLAGPYPVREQHHIIKADTMADISVQAARDAALSLMLKFPQK